MPEEIEVDTDKLRETIDAEMEKQGGSLLREIAVTTAVLAALAAIAALQAGATVNEALVLKTESTKLQAQASDQWAYYQAKGVKLSVQEAVKTLAQSAGHPAPAGVDDQIRRYKTEQQEIQAEARKLEHERDQRSEEADHLLHRHHGFANAVAMFQVAIALGAIAALTRIRIVWLGSIALGIGGLVFFALPLVR